MPKHMSIRVPNSIEFINLEPTEISPLISKCQIKVCYVGDKPNRNKSIITKEVALGMAPSLRGCPIVGFYNEATKDFEEHNRVIDISNGQFEIRDTTRPYGFVSTDANIWFEKFTDDGVEHEYLMTEGYIWTGQYAESQRIIDKGNNQSMELDEKTLNAYWAKDVNENTQFFIINEAIISKLCILGEEVEPCFEGSSITNIEFSFDEGVKENLYSLINQMKEILNEGGIPMFTTFAVEIGESLWCALWQYLLKTYPGEDEWCSEYRIEGIYEENTQKFMIVSNKGNPVQYFRINFIYNENGLVVEDGMSKVDKQFVPAEKQFALEDIEKFEAEYKAQVIAEEEPVPAQEDVEEPKAEEPEVNKPTEEPAPVDEENFALEEAQNALASLQSEYDDVSAHFAQATATIEELTNTVNSLNETLNSLNSTIDELNAAMAEKDEKLEQLNNFKLSIERKDKEDMIYTTFCMLDNEYKKDVIENIDTYSLDEIESKLAVICVRNKINLNLDTNTDEQGSNPITFNLNGVDSDDNLPAWVKAVKDVEKSMQN